MVVAVSSYVTDTISVPELIWTLVTGIGLCFNLSLFREAGRDLVALRKAKINSLREYAAISNVISEALRTFVQAVFFSLGVYAMTYPNVVNGYHPPIPRFAWILTGLFIGTSVVMAGASILDRVRRRRLLQLIFEYEDFKDNHTSSEVTLAERDI